MSLTETRYISHLEELVLNAEDIAAALRKEGDDEVSPRTVHFYRQQGILPPAYGRGDSAFGPEHLALMREARRLRRAGLALEEIKQRLAGPAAPVAPAMPLQAMSAATLRSPAPMAETVSDAVRARGGRMPRSLRFRDGFVIQ